MKVVVDSNIVFSAILNTQSKIGHLLINGSKYFEYFSIDLLIEEILLHKDKILKYSGFDETKFQRIFHLIIGKIQFIDDILLSNADIKFAKELVLEIDQNDFLFVALNKHLNSLLWTGDKKLAVGLKNKNYNDIIHTDEIHKIFIEMESNQTKLL